MSKEAYNAILAGLEDALDYAKNEQLTMMGRTPRGDISKSQWFTPRPLAKRLVGWAGIGLDDLCLEPSCGDGAFVEALQAALRYENAQH